MTKEINAGTGVEGSSTNPPSQECDAVENALSAHDSQAVDAMEIVPGTNVSTDAPSKGLEKELAALRDFESLPMTASNSTSSNRSNKDAGANGIGGAAYGTRSRNRTGTSRPNYAEDKEMDVDIEIAAAMKEGRKAARVNDYRSSTSTDNGPSTTHAKKITAPEPEHAATAQNHIKEPIPGTSTFSANPSVPATQSSKKRKPPAQPAASAAQSSSQNVVQNGPSTHTNTPRVNMAMHDSNMLSFDNCGARLKDGKLVADDGTVLSVNDHVYLVCEPPGEPYYLGRIMEFLHINNDVKQPIDALRLNWYYRPKEIGKKVSDTRQVFASMHSDVSPLTALRGKCQIKHKAEVEKLDVLRMTKDSFWYEKLYDRYIHRYYEVIPTFQVINVPVQVKKVLDERWKYIIVELGRGKEYTSAVKTCKRCSSNDSVDCAVCQNTYHMSCVSPPLLKKPSRGFAWACGPCSKAQEKKLEARNTPNITDGTIDAEDDEMNEDEDDFPATTGDALDANGNTSSGSEDVEMSIHPGTAEQVHQASLWNSRYLGQHCRVEDALDYDDRIHPRAGSRIGSRHQANVTAWPGRPVEYVKVVEIKKKYIKGGSSSHRKDAKLSKETIAALEADKIAREKRPIWVMDEPNGYIHRGDDAANDDPKNTATLQFRIPEIGEPFTSAERGMDDGASPLDVPAYEQLVNDYMIRAKAMAKPLGLPELSTNLLDVALQLLYSNNFDVEKALEALSKTDKKTFKEPELSSAELKKFEDGVSKFGSEWLSIKRHVKTMSPADVVRFYYTWKKTDRGKQIWGNYSGRKGKKEAKKAEAALGKLQDDIADDHDDSAFDNDKVLQKKKGFHCKFCSTRSSQRWRRAPSTPAGTTVPENPNSKGAAKEKGNQLVLALCQRCAELWRRYAIQYEDIEEVAKKVAASGGRASKRKMDEEFLRELKAANEGFGPTDVLPTTAPLSTGSTPAPAPAPLVTTTSEPPKKKVKPNSDSKDSSDSALENGAIVTPAQPKKKPIVEKPPPPPPPPPEAPKPKILPCAVCAQMEPLGDQHLSCKECRMAVHRNCYGVVDNRSPSKWTCDMCLNDKDPKVSIQYKCMLCPIESTEHDFVEPPKISHKKKSEKERERDRVERENAQKAADYFRKKQEELNKPLNPREPLKRTANNNWVHVTCAVFTPEVKFGDAKALVPSEGIPSIPSSRYDEVCKACKKKGGACVNCHSCRAPVHVECAHQNGYILGFDIAPVKGSRRDQHNIVNINGEIGAMSAAIWCKEHVPTKTIVHRMHDIVDETGLNALQLYVQNFKQADLALTGTVRKANLVNQSTRVANSINVGTSLNRRTSTTGVSISTPTNRRASLTLVKVEDSPANNAPLVRDSERICVTCSVDISPKWWPMIEAAVATSSPAAPLDAILDHDPTKAQSPGLTNGPSPNGLPGERNGVHVALAAAALHQNTQKPAPVPTEFQCHQCHWKKIRKQSTPTPTPSPIPIPIASDREVSRSSAPLPIPTSAPITANIPPPEPERNHAPHQYPWPPQPPSYPSNAPYNNWPRHSPVPANVAVVHQVNGNHSPRMPGVALQLGGPAHNRQHMQSLQPSPHQNGHLSQTPNGYPPSPHRLPGPPPMHMQNGGYGSYVSNRPPPHLLTNGGPPPRASEHPFSQSSAPMHPRPYCPPHGSPSLINRQPNGQPPQLNGVRPNDNRVNGGASASPSLRNLLS
ncbi:putative PHD type zinc finger protein with BAH domain-containing protein [Ciborinia camelliae]|nr:putative PHD type zinc finger protein with BAH domain-containing protein [Ciborinia camelliae]